MKLTKLAFNSIHSARTPLTYIKLKEVVAVRLAENAGFLRTENFSRHTTVVINYNILHKAGGYYEAD